MTPDQPSVLNFGAALITKPGAAGGKATIMLASRINLPGRGEINAVLTAGAVTQVSGGGHTRLVGVWRDESDARSGNESLLLASVSWEHLRDEQRAAAEANSAEI